MFGPLLYCANILHLYTFSIKYFKSICIDGRISSLCRVQTKVVLRRDTFSLLLFLFHPLNRSYLGNSNLNYQLRLNWNPYLLFDLLFFCCFLFWNLCLFLIVLIHQLHYIRFKRLKYNQWDLKILKDIQMSYPLLNYLFQYLCLNFPLNFIFE